MLANPPELLPTCFLAAPLLLNALLLVCISELLHLFGGQAFRRSVQQVLERLSSRRVSV